MTLQLCIPHHSEQKHRCCNVGTQLNSAYAFLEIQVFSDREYSQVSVVRLLAQKSNEKKGGGLECKKSCRTIANRTIQYELKTELND